VHVLHIKEHSAAVERASQAHQRFTPAFIQAAIGDLIDYDARKGTHLVRTVDAYFASGSNITRTKDALHVHVNTVTQRLERISQVLGEDWQLGRRALEIRIAAHLHRLGAERWVT
jgi:DNA-binding PucR family transcriptional regulator